MVVVVKWDKNSLTNLVICTFPYPLNLQIHTSLNFHIVKKKIGQPPCGDHPVLVLKSLKNLI